MNGWKDLKRYTTCCEMSSIFIRRADSSSITTQYGNLIALKIKAKQAGRNASGVRCAVFISHLRFR
jgi:hypothetical protein